MTAPTGAAPAQPPWRPANDVERRLRHAADQDDPQAVLRILAVAPLFLPDPGDVEPGGQRLLSADREGVRYLLVFTSVEALQRAVNARGWHRTDLSELVRSWTEGEIPTDWGLAVNPATPLGVLVAPERMPTLVPTPASLAGFIPANEVERLIGAALVAPDAEVLLDVLVTSTVITPTRALEVDGTPEVAVFTSPERCADYLHGLDVDGVEPTVTTCDLVAVLRQWPGPGYRLAVNPGSPIGFTLGGERVPELLRHATALAVRRLGPAPDVSTGPAPDVSAGPAPDLSGDPAAVQVAGPAGPAAVPTGGSSSPAAAGSPVDGGIVDLLRGRGR